jgi:outer membrane receptor protein involved in Fe transport
MPTGIPGTMPVTLAMGAIVSLLSVAIPTQRVFAQAAPAVTSGEQLEEVIVTAERRTSDVQKVGASVAVRSGEELAQQGRVSLAEILEDVPNVTVQQGAATLASTIGSDNQGGAIIIRGIPSNAIPVGPLQTIPTTAVYTDGVYEGIGNDYDIDRVEVLRGPQGTLYGRSATTGVVSTYTTDPTLEKYAGDISVEAGDYSLLHYAGAFNLPIGDMFAVRVSGSHYKHDGYEAPDGMDAIDSDNGRIKILFQPNDKFSLLLGAAVQDNHIGEGGPQGGLLAPNTVAYSPGPTESSLLMSQQYWANLHWDFGWADLTYIPAYRQWYQNANIYVPFLYPPNYALYEKNSTPTDEFVTHELRLASDPGSALTWLIGGFFYDNHLQASAIYPYPDGVSINNQAATKQTEDEGIFGEATYSITQSTRLTGGVRYDYTYVNTLETVQNDVNLFCNTPGAPGSGLPPLGSLPPNPACPIGPLSGSPLAGTPVVYLTGSTAGAGTNRYYNLTYKGRLEQDLTSHNMVYAMISTGFVPGDVQVNSSANPPIIAPFAEETLTSYELGSKNRFLDNRLQLNADVFYYRYGAYQATIFVNPSNPASAQTFGTPARALGAELDVAYLLTLDDSVRLSYGYTDAYFVDESAVFAAAYAQSHLVGSVPQTVTAIYDHIFHLPNGSKLTAHGDARFLSAHDVSSLSVVNLGAGLEPYDRQNDAYLGDVTLTWSSPSSRYSFGGYVRNIGDTRLKNSMLVQFGVPPPNNLQVTVTQPTTFGFILTASL